MSYEDFMFKCMDFMFKFVLFPILMIFISGMIILGLYGLYDFTICRIDKSERIEKIEVGSVINREFSPAHYSPCGRGGMCWHPDRWTMTIKLAEGYGDMEVHQDFYSSAPENSPVKALYYIGLRSKSIHLESLCVPADTCQPLASGN